MLDETLQDTAGSGFILGTFFANWMSSFFVAKAGESTYNDL